MTGRSVRATRNVTNEGTRGQYAALHARGICEGDRVVAGENGQSVTVLARELDHPTPADAVDRLVKTA